MRKQGLRLKATRVEVEGEKTGAARRQQVERQPADDLVHPQCLHEKRMEETQNPARRYPGDNTQQGMVLPRQNAHERTRQQKSFERDIGDARAFRDHAAHRRQDDRYGGVKRRQQKRPD